MIFTNGIDIGNAHQLGFQTPIRCKRLPDDLIHVVIFVSGKTPDEAYIFGGCCQGVIPLEQRLVFGTRNRIVGIALGLRIFIRHTCSWRDLSGYTQ